MKNKLTTFQVVTIILVILYLVWEWNIQEYLSANGLTNNSETRVDLLVIFPALLILVGVSLWSYFRKK